MSHHDGRLYNLLEQIVNLLKTGRGHHNKPRAENLEESAEPRKAKGEKNTWAMIALVVSVLAAGFTGWQALEAHKARIESGQAATDALYTSERAYLGIGNLSIYCPACDHPNEITLTAKGFFIINIINFGRTPASNVQVNATRDTEVGHGLPADFDFAEDPRANTPPTYIAPDTNNPLSIRLPALAADIAVARNQIPVEHRGNGSLAEHLYIYGHVSYTDVFNRHHTVLFCRGYTGPVGSIPEFWSRCATHEGEDDSFVSKKLITTPGFDLPQFDVPEPPDSSPPELREQMRRMPQQPKPRPQ